MIHLQLFPKKVALLGKEYIWETIRRQLIS